MIHQCASDLLLVDATWSGLEQQQTTLNRDCPLQLHRRALIDPLHGYYAAGLLIARAQLDLAEQFIDTAHSRLRKALEEVFGNDVRDHYLVLEKGMLSIRHARFDAPVFAQQMESARYHLQREQYWQAEQRLWRMERLWQGEFLNGYDLDGELPRFREQYNQLRLEQLQALAGLLVRRHEYQQAAGILRTGLLLDPTADGLARQLLAIYRRQADPRTAAQLLKDYRSALIREGYAPEEIDELIEAFGAHWFSNSINHHRENGNNE